MKDNAQPARWYMIDKGGMATLCVDREDAEKEAKDADMAWPLSGPHRAVRLVEAADMEALRAGYAAARLEIASLQARINTMAEEHADELVVAHLDGRMRAAQPAGAQQPAKAESLRQILTDPENQPNQYGVQFLMHGAKMAFRIGNRQFCLDYEPDEPGEFEFMRDALISAFSIFTPDVKLAQQPSPTPQADSQPAPAAVAWPRVTDAMALAFHSALSDGAIGSDEVEETKAGLRAALAAAPAQPAPQPSPASQGDALILQLVEALEGYRRNHNDTQPCDAERAGRVWLEGKP